MPTEDIGTYAQLVEWSDEDLDERLKLVGWNKNEPKHLREERNRRALEKSTRMIKRLTKAALFISLLSVGVALLG